MADEDITIEELVELKRLLEKWISHIEGMAPPTNPLVHASQLTYSFVNSTLQHQGVN